MKRNTKITLAATAVLGLALFAAAPSIAHGPIQGMGFGQGVGPGMGHGVGPGFGRGFGPGAGMGTCLRAASAGGQVTPDSVKTFLGRQLSWRNPNLKVGKVTEKDGTITAEIVTKDGSLVRAIQVDAAPWQPPKAPGEVQ